MRGIQKLYFASLPLYTCGPSKHPHTWTSGVYSSSITVTGLVTTRSAAACHCSDYPHEEAQQGICQQLSDLPCIIYDTCSKLGCMQLRS